MEVFDAMIKKIKWATDAELFNIWKNHKGIIIGRGENPAYIHDKNVATFKGKKFGCNGAYKVYDDLDALIWLDHSFYQKNCIELRKLKYLLFTVNSSIGDNIPLKVLRKNLSRLGCSSSFDQGFWTKNLTGFLALNVALVLGLNPVWLHGFIANYKRDHFIKRVDQFSVIADWCKTNGRTVYVADENSVLSKFFKYRRLPVPKAARTKKGVMPYGMGQGRTGIDSVRLGDELWGRPDIDSGGLQNTDKPIDVSGNAAGSDPGDNTGL